MEKFPSLTPLEVALARAEHSTGIVLDDQFKRYNRNSSTQIKYTIFENMKMAVDYIEKMKIDNADVEFIIFDHQEKLLTITYPDKSKFKHRQLKCNDI